jgi:hypothetical protein
MKCEKKAMENAGKHVNKMGRKVTCQASPDPPSPVVKPVKAKEISTGDVFFYYMNQILTLNKVKCRAQNQFHLHWMPRFKPLAVTAQ